MKKASRRIAVLTSGGDAPGMNACLRAIVRSAIFNNREVLGIRDGYEGLIEGKAQPLMLRSVGNIIQKGGTFLRSSRSKEFRTKAGRKKAYQFLKSCDVSTIIILGGDGTLTGASHFANEFPIKVIGVPVTIDNDLEGTDFPIGFDTAVNTAVHSIDKIRDTADSHGRVFVIEVMGRNTGHLALETAMAAGAEFVVVPEIKFNPMDLVKKIRAGIQRGKAGSIVIVAERDQPGCAFALGRTIRKYINREVREVILGHIQRGGTPTSTDRNIASRFGIKAVEAALAGKNKVMVGVIDGETVITPFSKVLRKRKSADNKLMKMVDILSI